MKENVAIKIYLVLQSFCPLFILIFIKYAGNWSLIGKFFVGLNNGDFRVIRLAIESTAFGEVIVTFLCIFWFILTGIVMLGFRNVQRVNFDSAGESIYCINEIKDSGVSFLVSFVIPLLTNDVNTLRGFLFLQSCFACSSSLS